MSRAVLPNVWPNFSRASLSIFSACNRSTLRPLAWTTCKMRSTDAVLLYGMTSRWYVGSLVSTSEVELTREECPLSSRLTRAAADAPCFDADSNRADSEAAAKVVDGTTNFAHFLLAWELVPFARRYRSEPDPSSPLLM